MRAAVLVEQFPSGAPLAVLVVEGSAPRWRCLQPGAAPAIHALLARALARAPVRRMRRTGASGRIEIVAETMLPGDPAYLQAIADRLTFFSGRRDVRARVTTTALRDHELQPL